MAFTSTHLLAACVVMATMASATAQTQSTSPMEPPGMGGSGIEPYFTPDGPTLLPVPPLPPVPPMQPHTPTWHDVPPDTAISSPPNPGPDGGGSQGMPGSTAGAMPMDPMADEPNPGATDTPIAAPVMPNMDANCALENAQALIGMVWDDSLLDGIQAPGSVRVLRPHDAATMDFSPTRLNILLDGTDTIVEASCG